MLYPYPKYNDEADAEMHVRLFLMTWQANHVSQRLSQADVDAQLLCDVPSVGNACKQGKKDEVKAWAKRVERGTT
mgnify:CR=1 FL=1